MAVATSRAQPKGRKREREPERSGQSSGVDNDLGSVSSGEKKDQRVLGVRTGRLLSLSDDEDGDGYEVSLITMRESEVHPQDAEISLL